MCTDEYTLTFTVPIYGCDGFVGVVGADVYARAMDGVLQPILARIDGPVAVLNSAGRVVTASGSEHETGDIVRDAQLVRALRAMRSEANTQIELDGGALVRCADLPLAVVTGQVVGT